MQKLDDEIETELIYSEAATPPSRCDDSVKQLCVVRWTGAAVPNFDKLAPWTNAQGEIYHDVSYKVQMVVNGPVIDFTLKYNKATLGSDSVNIDYSESGSAARDTEV